MHADSWRDHCVSCLQKIAKITECLQQKQKGCASNRCWGHWFCCGALEAKHENAKLAYRNTNMMGELKDLLAAKLATHGELLAGEKEVKKTENAVSITDSKVALEKLTSDVVHLESDLSIRIIVA